MKCERLSQQCQSIPASAWMTSCYPSLSTLYLVLRTLYTVAQELYGGRYPVAMITKWRNMFELPDDRRFTLTIVALSTISLTVSLSSTSLSNAIPVITNQFHGTDTQAFWSGTAYLLCSAVFQPAFAVASHHFGRKPLVSCYWL